MPFEQRDMSGALFANDRKEPGSNQPDYTGNGMVYGRNVRVAGWKKQDRNGKPFLSLSFSDPNERGNSPLSKDGVQQNQPDDEIPF